jgi:hypothetical protein
VWIMQLEKFPSRCWCATLNCYYYKNSCSYLHMYRRHSCSAKPSYFTKMQPKIHKAVLKITYLWHLTEK